MLDIFFSPFSLALAAAIVVFTLLLARVLKRAAADVSAPVISRCGNCKHWDLEEGQAVMRTHSVFMQAASVLAPAQMGRQVKSEKKTCPTCEGEGRVKTGRFNKREFFTVLDAEGKKRMLTDGQIFTDSEDQLWFFHNKFISLDIEARLKHSLRIQKILDTETKTVEQLDYCDACHSTGFLYTEAETTVAGPYKAKWDEFGACLHPDVGGSCTWKEDTCEQWQPKLVQLRVTEALP